MISIGKDMLKYFFICLILLSQPVSTFARCGGVDYSWGADALAMMHDFVVTMMLYLLYLIYVVASIVAIVAAFQIYYKMAMGEDGVKKSVMLVVGACLFLIGASIVFPAFFGYQV